MIMRRVMWFFFVVASVLKANEAIRNDHPQLIERHLESKDPTNFPLYLKSPIIEIFPDFTTNAQVFFKEFIKDKSIIASVSTEGGKPFTFSVGEDVEDTAGFHLIPKDNADQYGRYNKLLFLDANHNLIFNLTQRFRIIKSEDLPKEIRMTSIEFDEYNKFIIEFINKVYVEYEEEFAVRAVSDPTIVCNAIVKEAGDTNDKLNATCPFLESTDHQYSVFFMGAEVIGSPITVTCGKRRYFERRMKLCQPCRVMNAIWDETQCVVCNNQIPNDEMTACVDCPSFFDNISKKCVTDCPLVSYEYERSCYESCSSIEGSFTEENRCVKDCSEGKGADRDGNCIPILITSITNSQNLIAKEASVDFGLIFNSAFTSKQLDEIMLNKKTTKTLPLIGSFVFPLFTCSSVSFQDIEAGEYYLEGYKNNRLVTNRFPIHVKHFFLTQINPKSLQLPLLTPQIIRLSYTGTFLSTYSLQLDNVDTGQIAHLSSTITLLPGVVQFTLPMSVETEGVFKIRTIDPNKEVIDESIYTLLLYKQWLTITATPGSLNAIKGSTISSLNFNLSTPIVRSRIERVSLLLPGEQEQEITSFSINDKTLTITQTITFNKEGEYQIKIKEINRTAVVFSFVITTLKAPRDASYMPVFYYSDNSPSFEIDFREDVDLSIFGLIRAQFKDTGIDKSIRLLIQPKGDKQKYALSLADPHSNFSWGRYTNIVFNDKFNSNTPLLINKAELFILNVESIPLHLKEYEYFQQLNSVALSIVVSFVEVLEEAYFGNPSYFTSQDEKVKDIKRISDSDLLITFANEISSNTTITILSFGNPIELKISFINICPFSTMPNPSVTSNLPKCLICTQYNQMSPYYYEQKCYKNCPPKTVMHSSSTSCFSTCSKISAIKVVKYGSSCITPSNCIGKFLIDGDEVCYDHCPTKYKGFPMFTSNNKCVRHCPIGQVSNELNVCVKAGGNCLNTDVEHQCIEQCPPGTEMDNNKCVLPSLPSSTSPVKCTNSFCKAGTCSVVNNQRVCLCPELRYGLTCEMKEEEIIQFVDASMFRLSQNDIINIKHPEALSFVLTMNSIYKANSYIFQESIKKQQYTEDLITVLKSTIKQTSSSLGFPNELLIFVGFGLKVSIVKLKQSYESLRHLQEDTKLLKEYIRATVDEMTIAFELEAKKVDKTTVRIIKDDIYLTFTALIWSNDVKSIESYNQLEKTINFTSVKVEESMNAHYLGKPYVIISTDLSEDLSSVFLNEEASRLVKIGYFTINENNALKRVVEGNALIGFEFQFLNSTEKNFFEFYIERGSNIYDPNTASIFTEPCYFNREFPFDLPQLYRYNNLSTKEFAGGTADCVYFDYDYEKDRIEFNCKMKVTDYYYMLIPKSNITLRDHVKNLPMLCLSKITQVEQNFAFWTYLWVIVIGLVGFCVLVVISWFDLSNSSILTWIDEIKSKGQAVSKDDETIKTHKPLGDLSTFDMIPESSFASLPKNFFALYPLINLSRQTAITPNFFKAALLMYNILNYFGFNALFYNESMIEAKMTDESRNNFAYPIKAECLKIIYSIIVSMGLTMVVRSIVLITAHEKDTLYSSIMSAITHQKRLALCIDFWKKHQYRRIITYLFMCILTVFLYVYSVGFCGIYVNTQYSWFYSGIWTLLINWALLAPVSIVMISLIESKVPGCAYYAKQLFWF